MKKSINTKISSLLVLLSVTFTVLTTASFAWFATFTEVLHEDHFAGSSIASYFYEGEGTEEYPYVINDARHLYNLAWLQQTGVFTAETHFAICNNWKEKQPIILDMGGKISGADEKNYGGAIPPIGTDKAPFIGHFNGYGSTISNLWVSTKMEDWKEQPHGDNGYASTHVGLFGAVSGDAIIENFVLDTIEVKTTFDATVGIICGLVDANVQNVGVYNAILNISDGATASSKYSLIGDKTDRVIWEDLPQIDPELDGEGNVDTGGDDDEGGVIRIDINDGLLHNIFTGSGQIGNNKQKELGADHKEITEEFVPDVAPKRSYLVGDVTASAHQKYTSFYIYSKSISSKDGYTDGEKTVTGVTKGRINDGDSDDFESFVASSYYADYQTNGDKVLEGNNIFFNQDFYNRLLAFPSKPNVIKTGAPPTTASPANVTTQSISTVGIKFDDNGDEILVPANGIWFKPMAEGPSIIAFSISNSGGGDEYRSIYRYKRNGNEIDASSWTETKLVFPDGFANCDVIAFQYYIEPEDVAEGYEFLIGTTSDDNDYGAVSFSFLALAGASTEDDDNDDDDNTPGGGDDDEQEPPKMYDLDYVISPTTKVAAEGYENHKTVLRVTDAKDTRIYYLAAQTADDSDVFYYKTATATIADISIGQESAVGAWGVNLGTGTAKYKNRDDSDPQIYGPQPT